MAVSVTVGEKRFCLLALLIFGQQDLRMLCAGPFKGDTIERAFGGKIGKELGKAFP